MTITIEEKISEWVTPALDEMGLFLVEVKVLPGNKIQVFVDSDSNVNISQCARISRHLEEFMDNDVTISPGYNLEVSSPGMDNPLRIPRQYLKRIGKTLEILKMDGTMIEACLLEADEEQITVQEWVKEQVKPPKKGKKQPARKAGDKHTIPYEEIKRSKVQFNF